MTPLEVLKNKDEGIMLYSPCYGHVKFFDLQANLKKPIGIKDSDGYISYFLADGKYQDSEGAQAMLFPSINMKEWDKFNFKKGDILEHDGGMEAVEFISYETSEDNPANNYTMFKGKIILPEEAKGNVDYFTTWCFSPVKKPNERKFKPFDKILYKDGINKYHIGIVEKQDSGKYVHLIGLLTSYYIADVYPYKKEMEKLVGEFETKEREEELNKILNNE